MGKPLGFAILACLLTAGCTGGVGGGGSSLTVTLTGVASAGPVSGATVHVYELKPDGVRGRFAGSGTTDAAGVFRVAVLAGQAPLEVVVSGGVYIEEAGSLVPLQRELSTMLAMPPRPVPVAVTPLTRVAALHARNLVASGGDLATAIRTAHITVSALFGELDVVHTLPGTPESPGEGAEAAYTAVLIALSQYAVSNGFTSQDFPGPIAQFLAPPGIAGSAQLPHGQPVTAAFFSQALAAAAQQFAASNPGLAAPALPALNPSLLPEP